MTLYDIAMSLILVVGIAQGAWRGMIGQIAPVASLLLGYVIALPLSAIVAPWFGSGSMNRIVALLVLYLLVALSVYMMVRSIRETLERHKLQDFDRHVGALLGGGKGLLFALAVTFFAVGLSPSARPYILPTYSGFAAAVVMDRLHAVMPGQVHGLLEPYIHKLDDTLPQRGYDPIGDRLGRELGPDRESDVMPERILGDKPDLPRSPQSPSVGSETEPREGMTKVIQTFFETELLDPALRTVKQLEEESN